MFKCIIPLFIGCFLSVVGFGQPVSYTWTGDNSNLWSDPANWFPNDGEVPGEGSSLDDATFNGSSSINCIVDARFIIDDLNMNGGYGGTVTVSDTLIVADFSMDAGQMIVSAGEHLGVHATFSTTVSSANFNVLGTLHLESTNYNSNAITHNINQLEIEDDIGINVINDDINVTDSLILNTDLFDVIVDLNDNDIFTNHLFYDGTNKARFDNGRVHVAGNFTSNNVANQNGTGDGFIHMDGAMDQTIAMGVDGTVPNLIIDKPSGTLSGPSMNVSLSLVLQNGPATITQISILPLFATTATIDGSNGTDTLLITGILTNGDGFMATVRYDGPINMGPGSFFINTLIPNTVNLNGQTISISNFNNLGLFNSNAGTVIFTNPGTITSVLFSTTFDNLKIDLPNNTDLVKLSTNPITIAINLDLVNGILGTGIQNIFINNFATITNASANSFVATQLKSTAAEGFLIRQMNASDNFTFDVGSLDRSDSSTHYAQVVVEATDIITDFSVKYLADPAPNDANLQAGLQKVSDIEYFELSPSTGVRANITLVSKDITKSDIISCTDLQITHYDAGFPRWEMLPVNACLVFGGEASIRSNGVSTFSDFTFASTDTMNSGFLPIELLWFHATPTDHQVELGWETASEKDNDFFTIQRSTDNLIFEDLLTINGAGNSAEPKRYLAMDDGPLPGVSYYRLKQTDFDGTSETFNAVSVHNYSADIKIYPNPSDGDLHLLIPESAEIHGLKVFKIDGQLVYDIDMPPDTLNLEFSKPGVYLIQLTNNRGRTYSHKFIKK